MKLLDLFCGAGGCSEGYRRAGFTDITGVDISPQPRYPFKFIRRDAIAYLWNHGHEYDVIHASPPCQAYSKSTVKIGKCFADLVPTVRVLLRRSQKPFVIENVPGSPMRPHAVVLCGTMFGLTYQGFDLHRHRLFETSHTLRRVDDCEHKLPAIDVVGKGSSSHTRSLYGGYVDMKVWQKLMGIDWMTQKEIVQAIPPAYTHYIGRQILSTWMGK